MLSNPMKLTTNLTSQAKQNKKRERTEEDGNNSIYLHTERNGRRNFLS